MTEFLKYSDLTSKEKTIIGCPPSDPTEETFVRSNGSIYIAEYYLNVIEPMENEEQVVFHVCNDYSLERVKADDINGRTKQKIWGEWNDKSLYRKRKALFPWNGWVYTHIEHNEIHYFEGAASLQGKHL